ncbi:MAG TPA: ABC transporter ATP-binding protein [Rhizobiaceae bacterium]|nr:ABC transporter ATP-binding protein [Rhizobiaceae bacterium]
MANIGFKDVRKSFGAVEVIKGVDMDIRSGEFMVFVGPSGCGKSTLLRLISGLEDITSGDLLFDGERINDLAPSRRGVAMVFQSYALYPHMNAFHNMAFGMQLSKLGREEISKRVQAAARMLHIEGLLDRLPRQLSGGQRQRVAIGRAIVRDPRVFLFDEPLSNLDAALRVSTRIEIARLHNELDDTTMIYVTHDQVEAMTLADRICVLRDGAVEQVGTPLDLYNNPRSLFVAGFIGSPRMNFLTGGYAQPFGCATIGVRAEHIEIALEGMWCGRVIHSENLGSDTYVYVDMEADEPVIIRRPGTAAFAPGATVNFSPMPGEFHRFDEMGTPLPRQ